MIKSIHTLVYAADPDAARKFFRDTLGLPFADAGGDWLIFALPPAELGIHPADGQGPSATGTHTISLMCDDVAATMEALRARGVEFTRPIRDEGWGITTVLRVPGAGEMMLYQARHASPLKAARPARARKRPSPESTGAKRARKTSGAAAKPAPAAKKGKKKQPRRRLK